LRKFALFLLLTTVLPSLALYHYRNRIYLWDMIARVNVDGNTVPTLWPQPANVSDTPSARAYINALNDLYLERTGFATTRLVLQHGFTQPIDPQQQMRCWLRSFCLASADALPPPTATYAAKPSMTSRLVQWIDAENHRWVVHLW